MVGNVTIQGQITGTATFDGAKISARVTIAPPINATVNFGGGISTIEQLPDPISDSSNIYAWIRGTLLTGLDALSDVAIAVEDTVLGAFAKLQGQINSVKIRLGLLEDRIIFDSTLLENVGSFEITVDKHGNQLNFIDGDCFTLIFLGGLSTTSQQLNVRLNDISTSDYINAAVSTVFGYSGSPVTRLEVNFTVTTKSILAAGKTNRCNADYTGIVQTSAFASTKDNSIPLPIAKIEIRASVQINAGTRIIIRKC